MRWAAASLAAVILLALPPAVHAQDLRCLGLAPPCGYITPLMDLEFPQKPRCGAGAGGATKCIPVPAEGDKVTFAGVVRWHWKLSEDGTYPPDLQQPIVVTFSGTASNPRFLTAKVDPPQFTIQPSDLFDPRRMPVQDVGGAASVYYAYEQAVNVTFTRAGEPTAAERDRIAARDGVLSVFVKAQSTSSGAYFREAFGIEEFRFNGTSFLPQDAPPAREAPGPGAAWAVPAVAAAGLLMRRRRSR